MAKAKAKHHIRSTHIEHHEDGSHTIHHTHAEGPETGFAVADDPGLMAHMGDMLGQNAPQAPPAPDAAEQAQPTL